MYRAAVNFASKARIASNGSREVLASSGSREIGSRLGSTRNYAAKDIRFGLQDRALMLKGVEDMADALKVTMGPKIGGASEAEVSEKKARVTDALNASKVAVEEGIVPGGGVAHLYASRKLEKLQTANFGQKIDFQIIQNALKTPVQTTAANAGVEGAVVVGKLLEQDNTDLGYDAAKGECVDMVKGGIIDTLKVIRTTLADAASVSSLKTTTEAVVSELPKEGKEIPPTGPGMGGMDF